MKLSPVLLALTFALTACGAPPESEPEGPETGTCRRYGPAVDESECAAGQSYYGCTGGVAPDVSGCKAVSAEEVYGQVVVGFCCPST